MDDLKGAAMPRFRLLVSCFILLFLVLPFSIGQSNPVSAKAESEAEFIDPFKITVNVSEVRLDVVVVDGRGRPITDLTADDFEIYQNKQPQEVASSVYISDQMEAAAWPSTSPKTLPNIPSAAIKKEEVRRTILFVVDTLSMSGEDMYNTKRALRLFVERQMQPGDLVAIMRTGYGNSVLDMFLSDKRQLLARVDALYEELAMPDRIYGSQLAAISYGIRALKDMPGRKSLFLLSSEYTIATPEVVIIDPMEPINYYELYASSFYTIDNPEPAGNVTEPTAINMTEPAGSNATAPVKYSTMYDSHYSQLADEALRAGVVIHLLVPRGLQYYAPDSPEDIRAQRENYSFINPLPAKTGGILVRDSNFFLDGIGQDANNMIAGYYLVSYTPPPGTFDRTIFHRMTVRVKRKGAVVYTREGFYGRADSETDSVASTEPTLQDAIFSPFHHPELNVNVAAGYIKEAKAGYLIRSWIHLDARDVKMVETEDGVRIVLDAVCLTSGINKTDPDLRQIKYIFDINPENIAWIQEHGIRFSMLLPVKKPGSYTVRVAIQDMESGRIGTAYQFVEIPDLKKKGLALSDIFMITSTDDLIWMHSDVTKEITEGLFFPELSKNEVRSPALRTYAPGDKLQTLMMIYNADAKAIANSEIETQSILYNNGEEFLRNDSRPIAPGNAENPDSISNFRVFTLGSDIQPGNYTMQLLVTDKKGRENLDKKQGIFSKIIRAYLSEDPKEEKKGAAAQTLSFTVTEKPSGQ